MSPVAPPQPFTGIPVVLAVLAVGAVVRVSALAWLFHVFRRPDAA